MYIDRRAKRVKKHAGKVGRALSKLSFSFAVALLLLGGMAEAGWC